MKGGIALFNIHIPRYERIWLAVGTITLVIFLALFGFLAVSTGLNPPGHMKTIDPNAVFSTAPFQHPGVQQIGPNEYNVTLISSVFMFQPDTINIPAGAKIHFQVTSPDVVHGILIPRTNVNMMVLPGHITEYTYTFKEPGAYLLLCNEYCGTGHHYMMGILNVQ